MDKTRLSSRFFSSTRGRIVRLLRGAARTVDEMANSLDLTDNAVRAHLATLERDGLVAQSGVRRGVRKPHFTYELTLEAEALFPKSYDALFNALVTVLKEELPGAELKAVLKEAGRRLAAAVNGPTDGLDLTERSRKAAGILELMGGAPRVNSNGERLTIESSSCPIATAVEAHPEACRIAEALVAQITGARVRERCDRTVTPPRCAFEITEKNR